MSSVDYHDMFVGNVVNCGESPDPSLDPYTLYVENMPMKIMLTTTCKYSTDFSEAFDKFKRALTIIPRFVFKCSNLHSSKLHTQMFNKLLQDSTVFELVA